MYRIVKRIVHTVTTVTLVIRWEDPSRQETVEEQIVLPSSHTTTEEEVADPADTPVIFHQPSDPALDNEEKP